MSWVNDRTVNWNLNGSKIMLKKYRVGYETITNGVRKP